MNWRPWRRVRTAELLVDHEPETATVEDVLDRLDALRERLATLSPTERRCARTHLFERWADGDTIVRGEN